MNLIQKMYLDYINAFISVQGFANSLGISKDLAQQIIDEGREIHETSLGSPDRIEAIKDIEFTDMFGVIGDNAIIPKGSKGRAKWLELSPDYYCVKFDCFHLSFYTHESKTFKFIDHER